MGPGTFCAKPDRVIPIYTCPVCGIMCCTWHRRRHEKGARHKARGRRSLLWEQGWSRVRSGYYLTYRALRVPMRMGPSTVSRYGINHAHWIPTWARRLMAMAVHCVGKWEREDDRRILRRMINQVFREARDALVSASNTDYLSHCGHVEFASLFQDTIILAAGRARAHYLVCTKCGRLVHRHEMKRHWRKEDHRTWLESVTNVA